ncbi:MAG: efflux transporter outer membrane subunit [Rhodoferax sp.]|uniref:efflux transporter outer membrane subunit n=1 Tax=Rhodoferax sp. TaxID=50421 RepID=UPI00261E5A1E|nr:efflux transporter outer membrane subunit [Rhodoferax sp.]MDD2882107.1 efflux transporter outer membrane subunit [Rhodoferax sp.]
MNKKFMTFRPLSLMGVTQAAALFIAGCSLMPTYERPGAPVPAQWPASASVNAGATATSTAASATPLAWQDYFTDPTLRQLIDTALANNRDLRVAMLNIEQAKAQLGIRRADQLPTLSAGVTGSRTPDNNGAIKSAYTAGLTVTAYELDFFGRVASLKEQALSQYLATAEAAQTAQISLIATVAQSWLSLLADEELLAVSRQTMGSREESLKLVELKIKHGAASDFELRGAQTLLESNRVTLAQQTRQRALDENALVLLLGQPLNDATRVQLARQNLGQMQLAELPAGLPSDLLTRRPDIRQAEQNLIASNANIGAARAAFFPRISLTAGAGSASSELSGLFKNGSWGWTLAPQLVLPIFDAGRNQANLDASRAGRDIAVAQYEKSIQSAFREVADALASRATLAQQLQASQALLDAETSRSSLTQLRLDNGAANQLDWLDAKRSLFAAQQALVQTRLAYLQNQIALFKTLGGGANAPVPAASAAD